MAPTASHKALTDSGVTAHMMRDVSVIIGKVISAYVIIGTAGKDAIKVTAQRDSTIELSGREKPLTLNWCRMSQTLNTVWFLGQVCATIVTHYISRTVKAL